MQSFEIIGEIAEIETNYLYPAEYFVLVVVAVHGVTECDCTTADMTREVGAGRTSSGTRWQE